MSSSSSASSSTLPKPQPSQPFLPPELASYFIGTTTFASVRQLMYWFQLAASPALRLEQSSAPSNVLRLYSASSVPSFDLNSFSPDRSSRVPVRINIMVYGGPWYECGAKRAYEGAYMRGNGINCVRIVPYSAVQFSTYEVLKKFLTFGGTRELDTPRRLTAGALAGSTYPLDLVRARLSIATASIPVSIPSPKSAPSNGVKMALSSAYHTASSAYSASELTIVGMTRKIIREEGGVRGLYRGIVATAMGVAPYVGLNFSVYEALRGIITPPGKNSVPRKLACGALAGSISQTLTYPFDKSVTGMQSSGLGIKYTGALDALRGILRSEGPAGLYRGLWPNLLKVAPSIATSFATYELVKEYLLQGQ
ncbi:Mitochondrial carrier [Mycena kentingensis (nom. inval.)]|nr:Mitochondrial carrier [Mycena kentingensis (nom. inval.)]